MHSRPLSYSFGLGVEIQIPHKKLGTQRNFLTSSRTPLELGPIKIYHKQDAFSTPSHRLGFYNIKGGRVKGRSTAGANFVLGNRPRNGLDHLKQCSLIWRELLSHCCNVLTSQRLNVSQTFFDGSVAVHNSE